MGENWRPVPGWEGIYSVSDLGRVRTEARMTKQRSRWGGLVDRVVKERILSQATIESGHKVVCLKAGDRRKMKKVHRLVLRAFKGDPLPGRGVCRHLNGDPADNRPENLAWGTHKENTADARRHGTLCKGERIGTSKLTEDDVRLIRGFLKAGEPYRTVARRFDVCHAMIGKITNGEAWGWLV